MNILPLLGKVAIVAGGTGLVGAAIVRRLARDGADIAFSYFTASGLAEQLQAEVQARGRRAVAVRTDFSQLEEIEAFVWAAHDAFGRLDILVNAVSTKVGGSLEDPDVGWESVQRQFDVNVRGMVATVRTAVPLLIDGGRIVSVGPVLGCGAACDGLSDFAATKAAVAAYMRGWCRELGARSITVNDVEVGPIATGNEAVRETAIDPRQWTALQRQGTPDDVANAVAFLVGPDSGFITGTSLRVDGGFSV